MEKLSAWLLGTANSAKPATQKNWIVPTNPGAEGIIRPMQRITNRKREADIDKYIPNEISKKYIINTAGSQTNKDKTAE